MQYCAVVGGFDVEWKRILHMEMEEETSEKLCFAIFRNTQSY